MIEYFANDPLNLLYFIGGSGGIWYWINQWRDRIRIRVRLQKETFDLASENDLKVKVEYEIENVGSRTTSLEPTVFVSGYTPKKEYVQASFEISDLERELPPFKPKMFRAAFKIGAVYPFLLFISYTFRPTRGIGKRLRVWSIGKRHIGFVRFYYELLRFKLFGIYDKPSEPNS
ncbi:hypothetical protein [Candidatus Thiodiazotropha sp. CDECU1]|uniref:hypothetical protein n=1 Tax=Candidatus Thiodiazotropha sp. CDECU1 TaxID=3065865 RepID=UPI00292FE34E|nr:hypothetical protein [Candidatus Thiodiazotropha sp. CDECU1]